MERCGTHEMKTATGSGTPTGSFDPVTCVICGWVADEKGGYCGVCVDLTGPERKKRQKDEVLQAYGGWHCGCCCEETPELLCIDHIEDDGKDHRTRTKEEGMGESLYTWIVRNNFPPHFQVLCNNCNIGKFRGRGVCPHPWNAHLNRNS